MEEQFSWRELLLQQCEERHLADWFPLLSPYGTRYINVDLRLGCRRLLRLEPDPGCVEGGLVGSSNRLWRGGKDGGSVSDCPIFLAPSRY
jgi:hypothetical protein